MILAKTYKTINRIKDTVVSAENCAMLDLVGAIFVLGDNYHECLVDISDHVVHVIGVCDSNNRISLTILHGCVGSICCVVYRAITALFYVRCDNGTTNRR